MSEELSSAIDTIIKAKVAEALAHAGDGKTVLDKFVDAALSKKLEIKRRGGYGTDEVPFLDFTIAESVRDHVERAVREVIADRADEIKKLVKEKMSDAHEKFATAIIDGFATEDWRAQLNIKLERERD